ncbi:MAG: DUF4832 domain-containing protein [Clostridiales bacterium]|nr:DUF4832 domain-containing protein [Clostridiales bacterium]
MKVKNDGYQAFLPSDEVLQNPYIGFMSFNHFRNEPLFSDTGTKMGWVKERYPVYDWVEQKGREEGYYPDTEVAYFRVLWKDVEPMEGKYDFPFIEEILKKAKERNQTVVLRIMPHTTRQNEDVPDWLKEIIDCPLRPDEGRVKESPKDPIWIEKFGNMIEAVARRFDGDKTLYAVDISLTGAWGEGHAYSSYPQEKLQELYDKYTKNFKNTHILGQFTATNLLQYGKKSRPIGLRADGVADPNHMNMYYPEGFYPVREFWKSAPVSFESFWFLNEWYRQGWDIDNVIEQTLKWHVSTFNAKSSACPIEWKEKIDGWLKKMGYRFAVRNIRYPKIVAVGDEMELLLWIENRGVAPIYYPLPFVLFLKNEHFEMVCPTDIDVRSWLPGDSIEKISIKIPSSVPSGVYTLCCQLGGGEYPYVQFAMQTKKDGFVYHLVDIEVRNKEN